MTTDVSNQSSAILGKDVIVLLSGGSDSTCCVHYFKSLDFIVKGVFINHGQLSKDMELMSVKRIANYYDIKYEVIYFNAPREFQSGEIMGINAFLIFSALMLFDKYHGMIGIGIHNGTNYFDCSELFVKEVNAVLDSYSDGRIKLVAPFLEWDKMLIAEYCQRHQIPIHLTYSCENGTNPPCGQCTSCKDRRFFNVI